MIREYGLKKKTDETCFPVFFDEEENILLTVTGCGMNAAAAAVMRICTKRTPQPEDFLVNIGTCAWISCGEHGVYVPDDSGYQSKKKIYLCKKITEHVTGRTFYPDILYRHPFTEAEIFYRNYITKILLYHFIDPVMLIYIIPELLHKRTWIPVFHHSHIYISTIVKILDI